MVATVFVSRQHLLDDAFGTITRSMNLYRTCGIVLRTVGHGESDKLVTFYSPDIGRVTGIAKGAKRSKRRFVNKLEECSLLQIFYRPPKGTAGLFLISEAELLDAHLPLRTDVRKYAAAMYLCELVMRFTHDNDSDPRLYAVLQWALEALSRAKTPLPTVALAHLRLLDAVGYRPELNRCTSCRQAVVMGRTYKFLPGNGTLLCNRCSPPQDRHSTRLSVQTLSLLVNAQSLDLDRLHRLQFAPQALHEAMTILHQFSLHLLQQDLHSWQILWSLDASSRHRFSGAWGMA
jgi:DNA repair protein RecO (recombination protein O)